MGTKGAARRSDLIPMSIVMSMFLSTPIFPAFGLF